MLGVGFFIGMKVASIDLQNTMTTFVEDNNFYDIKISFVKFTICKLCKIQN